MVKVFITYDLAPGVTREQYWEWSRTVDQPLASRQPGVLKYEIYWMEGSSQGEPWCKIVEAIEAESWEAWQKVNILETMVAAVEQFFQIADRDSIRVIYGTKIEV